MATEMLSIILLISTTIRQFEGIGEELASLCSDHSIEILHVYRRALGTDNLVNVGDIAFSLIYDALRFVRGVTMRNHYIRCGGDIYKVFLYLTLGVAEIF